MYSHENLFWNLSTLFTSNSQNRNQVPWNTCAGVLRLTPSSQVACADPEGFFRGCPTLPMFISSWWGDPNTIKSGPSSGRQRNACVQMMAKHWMMAWRLCDLPGNPNQYWRNPIFGIFQGGGVRTPYSPLWIRAWVVMTPVPKQDGGDILDIFQSLDNLIFEVS